ADAGSRGGVARSLVVVAACGAAVSGSVAAMADVAGPRLVQYAVLGGVVGGVAHLVGVHTVAEAPMRPVRIALAGDTGIGDALPCSRPTFSPWANLGMV